MEDWDELDFFEVIDHFADIDAGFSSPFIESIEDQWRRTMKLSDKQRAALENIVLSFDMQARIREYYDTKVSMMPGEKWLGEEDDE